MTLDLDLSILIPALAGLAGAILGFIGKNLIAPAQGRETSFADDARERLRSLEQRLWDMQTQLTESHVARAKLEDRVQLLEADNRRLSLENDLQKNEIKLLRETPRK